MRSLILSFIFWVACMPALAQEPTPSDPPGAKSLEERIEQLEKTMERPVPSSKWYDRIQLSGRIEVEAGYGKTNVKDPAVEDEETSDLDLATVELNADAKIAEHVDGHVKI